MALQILGVLLLVLLICVALLWSLTAKDRAALKAGTAPERAGGTGPQRLLHPDRDLDGPAAPPQVGGHGGHGDLGGGDGG